MTAAARDKLLLLAPLLGVAALALVNPAGIGQTFCPVALVTGTACPGCGMTRAASHLVRGDFAQAFALHPLVVLIALQAVGAWVWYLLRRSGRVPPMRPAVVNALLIGTALALGLVWTLRYLSGTLPAV